MNELEIKAYIKKLRAEKIFDRFQIAQIEMGLENNIDVDIYLDPEYDFTQMESIRLGLEDKLNVYLYLYKDMLSYRMDKIRRDLEHRRFVRSEYYYFNEEAKKFLIKEKYLEKNKEK
ncbi:MAG: hypothetical protein R3Y64_11220 [Peptostreptococcaceae bacterium]